MVIQAQQNAETAPNSEPLHTTSNRPTIRDWLAFDDSNVIVLRPAQAGRRRGRPKKPTSKAPVDPASFDAVAATIRAIPPDKSGAPGRGAAKDAARAAVGCDARLSRAAVILFSRLIDEVRWKEGRCCYSNGWFAQQCAMDRSTVTRAFKALRDAGHVLRRRRKTPTGNFFAETTIPALARAWQEVGAEKSGGGCENTPTWAQQNEEVGANSLLGRCENAPIPPGSPPVETEHHGGAHAREHNGVDATPEEQFSNGEISPDAAAEPAGTIITPQQFEAFRDLGDTFGRPKNAIVVRPTGRDESDPLLVDLVRVELSPYPPEIAAQALSAGLRAATAVRLRDIQDGSAGKGRGGLPALNNFLEKVLPSKADHLMRARDISEAKNRTEKVVQEQMAAKRMTSIERSGGGGRRKGMSSDDVMGQAFGS